MQALEDRSRDKNPEYYKLSSLEQDPNSREELNELLKDPESLAIKARESINEHYGSITLISPRAELNNEPIKVKIL